MTGNELAPARRRVLRAVADLSAERPVTLTEIVGVLGGHPNTTRQQLDRLVGVGLLVVSDLSKGRPGRPPKGYALTERGRRALAGDHYAGLVGAVTSHLAGLPDPSTSARAVGQSWGAASVAQGSDEPVAAIVELLDILGFEPRSSGTHGDVVLTRCPLIGGGEHDSLACELHQGMLVGALRGLGATQGVRLVPFSHPDGCGVSFTGLEGAR